MAGKPVLGYWSVRGLGAQIRYILRFAGVEHDEQLYPQTFDDSATGYDRWSRREWMAAKFTLGLDFPNLPYFIDGDVKLTQCAAIQRYICTKWKPELLGTTPAEVGAASMLEGILTDMNGTMDRISFSMEGTQESLVEATKSFLDGIHQFLGDKPFLVGDKPTFVDFILFEKLERCQDAHCWDRTLFAAYPKFEPYHARVASLPGMLGAEERLAQGIFNGWRAKLGGAGLDMFKRYKQIE